MSELEYKLTPDTSTQSREDNKNEERETREKSVHDILVNVWLRINTQFPQEAFEVFGHVLVGDVVVRHAIDTRSDEYRSSLTEKELQRALATKRGAHKKAGVETKKDEGHSEQTDADDEEVEAMKEVWSSFLGKGDWVLTRTAIAASEESFRNIPLWHRLGCSSSDFWYRSEFDVCRKELETAIHVMAEYVWQNPEIKAEIDEFKRLLKEDKYDIRIKERKIVCLRKVRDMLVTYGKRQFPEIPSRVIDEIADPGGKIEFFANIERLQILE